MERAHTAQVKYYIYKLTQKGVEDVTGIIEYPKLKQREELTLREEEKSMVREWEEKAIDSTFYYVSCVTRHT